MSHFDTLQLHAGQPLDSHNARAPPIYATTSYVFKNSKHGAALFGLEEPGYIYSRIMNPTNDVFEQRLAALEGGIGAVAVSSGQAAQFLAIAGLAHSGDNIISSTYLYGGTYNQFKVAFKRLGIEVRFVGADNDFASLIDEKTKAIYVESIGNPKYNVPDFEALSKLGKSKGIPLVVDNTFGAGSYLISPFKHGADIIVHSATKWIGGHGTTIGGVIIDSGKFPWTDYPEKFPQFSKPSEGYHGLILNEALGKAAYIGHIRIELLRDLGPSLNPFGAFQLIQGLETLSLRVERQSLNARKLVEYFENNSNVTSISYLGSKSHQSYDLGKKYLNNENAGGMISFEVKEKESDDQDAAPKLVDALKIASNLANVGDSKTLIIAPWYTTHQQLDDDEKKASAVTKGLIRLSVGTEHYQDLIDDFEQAFNQVYN